jgi:hypothetical protein
MNEPYTDYGMYWEALTIRAPFSDSFIDEKELRTYQTLQRMQMNLTPDWNMAYQVPLIHGYTTLMPKDFSSWWETDSTPGINAIGKLK